MMTLPSFSKKNRPPLDDILLDSKFDCFFFDEEQWKYPDIFSLNNSTKLKFIFFLQVIRSFFRGYRVLAFFVCLTGNDHPFIARIKQFSMRRFSDRTEKTHLLTFQ